MGAVRTVGTSPTLRTLREPAVPILVLAGAVQVYRAYPADILAFFGTAALILWDAHRWPRLVTPVEPPQPVSGRTGRTVVGAGVVGAVGGGLLPRDSGWLQLGFFAVGLLVVLAVLRRWPARSPVDAADPTPAATGLDQARRPRRWYVWPALGLALALLELAAFLSQPNARTDNPDRPTISTIVEPLLTSTPMRVLAVGLWLAIGWWLLVRVLAWQARAR